MVEAELPIAAAVEPAAVVDVVEAMSAENGLQPALDLSDEIKEASFYVLLRALLDAASMLGSVNVVELAMWARWKMKYDTPQLAYPGPSLPALPRGASDELLHWLNVSSAAYKYSRAEFCATSGIPMSDLVATDLRSSTMRPAYVVCLDHAYEAIVLAIRGTHGLHDLLTDAAATNTAFLTGYAHSGMAHAVATLLGDTPVLQERAIVSSAGAAAATRTSHAPSDSEEALLGVARLLASCMKQHPSYRVVVCGHSLGGGVAALLTMRLFYLLDFDAAAQAKCGFGIRVAQSPGGTAVPTHTVPPAAAAAPTVTMHDEAGDDGFVHVTSSPPASALPGAPPPRRAPKSSWPLQPYPLHCYVFGPPPVASADVCEHFEPHITSTVMGADFVPRVSMHMLHQLRAQVAASRALWWQDAVVDLAASRVGQLSTTAVQHVSHALLAAKDLSSAALGNLSRLWQERFGAAGAAAARPDGAADSGAAADCTAHQQGEEPAAQSSSAAADAASPGGASAASAADAASPGGASAASAAEASEVYAELARDFIRSQHPDSTAGAQVDAVLRVGIQQGHPERVLGSGDDCLHSDVHSAAASTEAASDDATPSAPRGIHQIGKQGGGGGGGGDCTVPPGDEGATSPHPAAAPDSPVSHDESDDEGPLTKVLSLPGTILHVTPLEDKQEFGYEARIVPPSHFQSMLFTHDMWQHHKRRLYGRALAWINLRDTPQPRVRMRLPAHLVPGSGVAPPTAGAAAAPTRPVLHLPASVLPRKPQAFDAEAFLKSVVGSPVQAPSTTEAGGQGVQGE